MRPEIGDTVLVWLGSYGPKKPFGPQPGDAWIESKVREVNNYSLMVERYDNLPDMPGGIRIITDEFWKKYTPTEG